MFDPNLYTNHSGGALGADDRWDAIGRMHGFNNHIHYYHGKKTYKGNRPLTDAECDEGWEKVLLANLVLKRNPFNYRSLLSRNWFQVKMSEAVFAVSSFMFNNRSCVNGGTGWAVQMAVDAKKTVYVFDQLQDGWFTYNYDTQLFEPSDVPVLTYEYAGIGTREIGDNGLLAIDAVYEKTKNINFDK